jgi:hypothetical protein
MRRRSLPVDILLVCAANPIFTAPENCFIPKRLPTRAKPDRRKSHTEIWKIPAARDIAACHIGYSPGGKVVTTALPIIPLIKPEPDVILEILGMSPVPKPEAKFTGTEE